jgi:hypothetical protein
MKGLRIAFENGCIDKLLVGHQNIIEKWGFETADSASFFSLSSGGYRHKILEENIDIEKNSENKADLIVQMRDGKWKLGIHEKLNGNIIIRDHQLVTLEDSWFMDFVSRFQFRKEFFDKVIIAGRELRHRKTNLYYQYPVDEVKLIGKDFDIVVRVKEVVTAGKFGLNMYARDFEDVWVVHARLMPKVWDKEVVKICRSWYNKAIPQWMSRILLSSDKVKDYLWYRGERKQANFPLNAYALVRLKEGEKLRLTTETEIILK